MGAPATNSPELSLAGRVRRKLNHVWWLWRVADLHRKNVQGLNDFREVRSICFVCYGNICRSPAAAYFAKALRPDLTITSAGFYPTVGRTSPDYIVDTCKAMGIDLTAHHSRLVDDELVKNSDLIVCMDHLNWQQFEKAFPENAHKLVLLGPFGKAGTTTIGDPYARPLPEVQTTLTIVGDAVAGLLANISSERGRSLDEVSL
jgi:protein-tyrosine phosphatase